MATDLKKPVTRRSHVLVRERGLRRLVVTLYPAGYIGLRASGCRTEETLDIAAAYSIAVKSRVIRQRAEKKAAKKAKKF